MHNFFLSSRYDIYTDRNPHIAGKTVSLMDHSAPGFSLLLLFIFFIFFYFYFEYFFDPYGNFRSPYLGKAQQPQEQRYPFLSVSAVCSCVRTVVRLSVSAVCSCVRTVLWLPVFEIFNVRTDVGACNCTWELFKHRRRVCTGSQLWEENPLLHWGIEPLSVLCLAESL